MQIVPANIKIKAISHSIWRLGVKQTCLRLKRFWHCHISPNREVPPVSEIQSGVANATIWDNYRNWAIKICWNAIKFMFYVIIHSTDYFFTLNNTQTIKLTANISAVANKPADINDNLSIFKKNNFFNKYVSLLLLFYVTAHMDKCQTLNYDIFYTFSTYHSSIVK